MTLTTERIEEIRGQLAEYHSVCNVENYNDAVLRKIECESVRWCADLLSAYDALSRDGMREALAWISKIATAEYERDEKLRADGARTLKRIAEKAHAALSPDAPRPTSELVKRLLRQAAHCLAPHADELERTLNEAAASLQALEARNKELEGLLQELADAADTVGVRFFDTDTMEPEVEAMQAATLKARAALHPATKTGET